MKSIYCGLGLAFFTLWLATPAPAQFFIADTTIASNDTNYDGQDIVALGCTLTVDGSHTFADLLLADGAVLTHSPCTNGVNQSGPGGCILVVQNNVVIDETSAIRVDGSNEAGLGKGSSLVGSDIFLPDDFASGSGGGHGGYGGGSLAGAAGGLAYGVPSAAGPSEMGSSGGAGFGPGGKGGGLVNLSVGGVILLDGVISANGGPGASGGAGGGSGGSISLAADSIVGTGSISANGGAGEPLAGGGGGGGRIILTGRTNQLTGPISAFGADGYYVGGAGTIYLALSNSAPLLVIDNGGRSGTNTPIGSLTVIPNLLITNGAIAEPKILSLSLQSLSIGPASFFSIYTNAVFQMNVQRNVAINAGGGILLDATSYRGLEIGGTIDVDNEITGAGGGNGGYGGISIGGATGSLLIIPQIMAPIAIGSPGGRGADNGLFNVGGFGGGAMNLTVQGSLELDGSISANGGPGASAGSGGGSGGSIEISAASLAGAGSIAANGGGDESLRGGGGGGGRIQIMCPSNEFTGDITAFGGQGFSVGGAGTIFSQSLSHTSLLVDNGDRLGTNTPLNFVPPTCDLTIAHGAIGFLQGSFSLHSLFIGSNSFAVPALQSSPWTVITSATIQPGGGINADGAGYQSGTGPGTGTSRPLLENGSNAGGGGGHGGYGGSSASGALGGANYDSISEPSLPGSSGGSGSIFPIQGGAGGGAVLISVNGLLTLNGFISANGKPGANYATGGGSGGSIRLVVGGLAGSGFLSANGGSGNLPYGGGGGGGMVTINAGSNSFSGVALAHGGMGYVAGGAGTIFTFPSREQSPQTGDLLLIDNHGLQGTNTPLLPFSPYSIVVSTFDLHVTGGAIVQPGKGVTAFSLNSLLVDSNGMITQSAGQAALNLNVDGNAIIASNSAVIVDGLGYGGSSGSGAGLWNQAEATGGGGGYGGAGGSGAFGAPGGQPYGSSNSPELFGSGGGLPIAAAALSQGGGFISITAKVNLTIDGIVSSAGVSARFLGAGGGSGGSILLAAPKIAGNGRIAANGGSGDPELGGGGGGGRIQIGSLTNTFTGSVTVNGGPGFNSGQNGTLVFTNFLPAFSNIEPAPALSAGLDDSSGVLLLHWAGSSGATYQLQCSTNLIDWLPCGNPMAGSNGNMIFSAPCEGAVKFFRVVSGQ